MVPKNKSVLHKLLSFEGKTQPLSSYALFYDRVLTNILAGTVVILVFLMVGVVGYHFTCQFGWLDSLLNASMILSGMGPTDPIHTDAGKWFASFYALVSGVVFISTIGIILAPVAHRVFHRFHLEE